MTSQKESYQTHKPVSACLPVAHQLRVYPDMKKRTLLPAPPLADGDIYLSVPEAARQRGRGKRTLERWISLGWIKAYRSEWRTVLSLREVISFQPPASGPRLGSTRNSHLAVGQEESTLHGAIITQSYQSEGVGASAMIALVAGADAIAPDSS